MTKEHSREKIDGELLALALKLVELADSKKTTHRGWKSKIEAKAFSAGLYLAAALVRNLQKELNK